LNIEARYGSPSTADLSSASDRVQSEVQRAIQRSIKGASNISRPQEYAITAIRLPWL
jgi:hypothetical protein